MNATLATHPGPTGQRLDSARVGELFDIHAPALLRYAVSRLGRPSAEDVVSEVFLVALRGAAGYDSDRGEPRAWLFGIATNLIRRQLRDEARHGRLERTMRDVAAESDETRVIDRLDARSEIRRLATALDALSEPDREVLLLIAIAELNASEVAAVLNIPPGTVRSRLHRARRHLTQGEAR